MPFHSAFKLMKDNNIWGFLEGVLITLILIPIIYSFLPIGFKTSMVNFTYGERGLDPDFKVILPVLFLIYFVVILVSEFLLRKVLLKGLVRKFSVKKSLILHLVIANLVLIPFVLFTYEAEGMGFLYQLIYENLIQAILAYLFLRTSSLIATALCHTVINFIRFVFINDVIRPFETLYFYSSASEDLYSVSLAVVFFAFSIMVAWTQKWGVRE